jgi:hypothetical protein
MTMALRRIARTMAFILPGENGGGGPPEARVSERRVVEGACDSKWSKRSFVAIA